MSKASDIAYDAIRADIMGGTLAPGTQLREEHLAASLGVSRTPVREAMRRLQAEQLIVRTSSQRSFVSVLSEDEIAEAFTLRTMLEGHAAARATQRITPEMIEQLVHHNRAVLASAAGTVADVESFIEHNRAFHALILEAAASPRLVSLLGAIVEQPVVLRTALHYTPDQIRQSAAEHDELILAFGKSDPEWARAVMTAHIRRAFHAYKSAVRGEDSA